MNTELLTKLGIGAAIILIIGGIGFRMGFSWQQGKIDALKKTLDDYTELGKRVSSLKDLIEEDMKNKNEVLVAAYKKEMDKLGIAFGDARTGLTNAAQELKTRGAQARTAQDKLIIAIGNLPEGSAEWVASVKELIGKVNDPAARQAVCSDTPVPTSLVMKLKTAYALGVK